MRAPLGSLQLPKDPWDPPRFNHPPLRIRSACNPSTLRPRSFRSDGTWLVSRQAVAGGTHSPEALNPETLGSGLLPLSRVWGTFKGIRNPNVERSWDKPKAIADKLAQNFASASVWSSCIRGIPNVCCFCCLFGSLKLARRRLCFFPRALLTLFRSAASLL